MIVLDTSVVAKWFLDEEDSEKARRFLPLLADGTEVAVVPSILFLELITALRRNGFDLKEVQRALESLYQLVHVFSPLVSDIREEDNGFQVFGHNELVEPFERETFEDFLSAVNRLCYEQKIDTHDAVFVETANRLECDFWTADEELSKKAGNRPFLKLLCKEEPPRANIGKE